MKTYIHVSFQYFSYLNTMKTARIAKKEGEFYTYK